MDAAERVFAGGVYANSIPSGRSVADVAVGVDGIEARTAEHGVIVVPYLDMQIELGGTGGTVVFCHDATRTTTIYTTDDRFLPALSVGLHTETSEQARRLLSRATGKRWAGRGVWMALLAVGVVFVLALPTIFGWLVARAVDRLPTTMDERLGAAVFRQMAGDLKRFQNPTVDGAIQAMLERLQQHVPPGSPEFEFRVMVVDDDVINAFALPGGQMVFYKGLLSRAGDADEVAGVLAHEMAHVLKRHSMQRVGQSVGIIAGVGFLFGDTGVLAAAAAEYLTLAAINSYSREHESEADAVSVGMLHRAGLDPLALSRMFERMEKQGATLPDFMHWISTHPSHQQRIDAIKAQIERLPSTEKRPLAIDWNAVRRELGR